MFRLIAGLLQFFAEARHYSRIDPDHAQSAADLTGHRRIVATAAGFGLAGLLAGLLIDVLAAVSLCFSSDPWSGVKPGDAVKGVFGLLMICPIFGVIGTVFGASLACAFAPRAFYDSPVGRKWLSLVGVEGVGLARVVCLLVAGIIASLAAWVVSQFTQR